mgnify:FL=1
MVILVILDVLVGLCATLEVFGMSVRSLLIVSFGLVACLIFAMCMELAWNMNSYLEVSPPDVKEVNPPSVIQPDDLKKED